MNVASTIGDKPAYYDVSDYSAIKQIAEEIFKPVCQQYSTYCQDCHGFCGCGKCFCPECDDFGSTCLSNTCTEQNGQSAGCVTSIIPCPIEDDACTQYVCDGNKTGDERCSPVYNDCAAMKEANPGTCREVLCDPTVDGGCYVKLNDTLCAAEYGNACEEFECTPAGEIVPEEYKDTGCRVKLNKTAVKEAELVSMGKGCFRATCDKVSGVVGEEDTCVSEYPGCFTSTCELDGTEYKCKEVEKDHAADDQCVHYECINNTWTVVVDRDEAICSAEFTSQYGENGTKCMIVYCDPSKGCMREKNASCNYVCTEAKNSECVAEATNSNKVDHCVTGMCEAVEGLPGDWSLRCNFDHAENCLDTMANITEDLNKAEPKKCYTPICIGNGECSYTTIELPSTMGEQYCGKAECKRHNDGSWDWECVKPIEPECSYIIKADFVERRPKMYGNAFVRGTLYYLYDSCTPTHSRLRFEYNLPSGNKVSNLYDYGDGALYSMCSSSYCNTTAISEVSDPWWFNSTLYKVDVQDPESGLFWYSRKTLTATSQVKRILASADTLPVLPRFAVEKIEFNDGRIITLSNVAVNPEGLFGGNAKFGVDDAYSCPKLVCPIHADIVFVMDYSSSISSSEWSQAASFVTSVINSFTFGDDGVAAAVVQFNAPNSIYSHGTRYISGCGSRYTADCTYGGTTSIPNSRTASVLAGAVVSGSNFMTVTTSKDYLVTEMAMKRSPYGNTCQGFGLEVAMKVLDNSPRKSSATPIIIAVTDGVDQCPNKTAAATQKLKNQYGAFVVEIGVGMANCQADKEFLQRIASNFGSSSSKAYFDVADFSAIEKISNYVSNLLCDNSTAPECDSECGGFCACGECLFPEFDPEPTPSSTPASSAPVPSAPEEPSEAPQSQCPAGEYMSPLTDSCTKCTSVLHCATCSSGTTCDTCLEGYVLRSSVCVLDCAARHGAGCERCTERKCLNCTKMECCRRKMFYWDSSARVCQDPAVKFGEGCLETDGVKCTKCTSRRCCAPNEYYDYDTVMCRPCSDFGDDCEECEKSECLKCGKQDEANITVDYNGNCVDCEDLFGDGCTSCTETECTSAEDGYLMVGPSTISCSSVYGACNKCDLTECSECSAGFDGVNGYCHQCSEIFGLLCSKCNGNGCIECDEEAKLVNGVCVDDCEQAFGEGCFECNSTSCLRARTGYFIAFGYSIKCTALPDQVQDKCMNSSGSVVVRDVWSAMQTRDNDQSGESIDVKFQGSYYSVACKAMTDHCVQCGVSNSHAGCQLCEPGYVLVGGVCKSCEEQVPGGECKECSLTGCTACVGEGSMILGNGLCASCGDGFAYDKSSKSCVPCSSLFGLCSHCTPRSCTVCQEPFAILVDNKCLACKDIYGPGCSECNDKECTRCNNDQCCDAGEMIVSVNGTTECSSCKVFDESCSYCSSTECLACEGDLVVDPITKKCTSCQTLFEECGTCNSDVCVTCKNPKWLFTDNGCYNPDLAVNDRSQKLPASETATGSGVIIGVVIGCLVVVAIICAIVYIVVAKPFKGKLSHSQMDEDEMEQEMATL